VSFHGLKGGWETSRLVFQPRHVVFLEPAGLFRSKCLVGISLRFFLLILASFHA